MQNLILQEEMMMEIKTFFRPQNYVFIADYFWLRHYTRFPVLE
jgi:hypothetical protein